ncbi:selenium-dependent molybdenum cofactor biosynthesis protein YqeB [Fusobacterium perfoetens]|uniref:selenium-dependent molybdenum cofactor biosynthesis protein YqeB n=1 Tax=Fusobacterium perfoetens TaxID=852 RepID=UPI001F36B06A|nr:selenium-dependent molybdenum cofactor biosynthesis protein YqeB [Fusobacterium perfoetens]MCF2612771.1 EF2563 family selenium-dependent molybdenum hydroxylase system protein [Fusobacterium perfoetens]
MKVVIRGGGDLATGVAEVLYQSGFKILILDIEKPSSIRRSVCFSEAIYDGVVKVENIICKKVENENEIEKCWSEKIIPIMVDEKGEIIKKIKPDVVVDSIIAKKNLGTTKEMAPITVALGDGFEAGKDVDIVIETMRGHNLGRIITSGRAMKNTGIPGEIKGVSKDRVIYSKANGRFSSVKKIGDTVQKDEIIGYVGDVEIRGKISGVLRGIIREGYEVTENMKIGDIDPRTEEKNNCFTISDKARSLGGAVLRAIMFRLKEEREKKNGNTYIENSL